MRHLIIPSCLCLAAWSSATGPEPRFSLQNQISIGPVSTCCRQVALSYEQLELPLARLHPLVKPIIPRSRQEICETLADAARQNDLPAPFLIRLLYQESSFRPGAISSAGALGIAQFMPETATDRGLENPFDAVQAIPASARLLHDLSLKFGNLGLAAAAYNAGPKRIQDWLGKRGLLPPETANYVKTVTGWPAETWATAQAGSPGLKLPQDAPCREVGGLFVEGGSSGTGSSGIGAVAQQPTIDRISDQQAYAPKATSAHPRLPSRQINRSGTYGEHLSQEGQWRHDARRGRSVWSPE
jgi:transglycosylase-like protein with SLT domain